MLNCHAHSTNGGFGKPGHQMAVERYGAEIKIYTSNSFLYSAFYNFMDTFKGFQLIYQPFPDM